MPALDTYTSLLRIEVDGSPLADDVAHLLVRGRVTDGVDLPDAAELDFADDRGLAASRFPLGAAVAVRVAENGPEVDRALFQGEVVSLEREDLAGALHTRVRALDGAARLLRGTRVAAFVDRTVADVVREVAKGAGLNVGEVTVKGGSIPHLAQDNVSDWAFLSRLARATGSTFSVTAGRLDFGPPTSALDAPSPGAGTTARDDPVVVQHGANAQYVRAVVTAAEQVSRVSVRGWDPATKKAVVASADAATRSAHPEGLEVTTVAQQAGSRALLDVRGDGVAASQHAAAASLADRLAGGFAEVEAVVLGNAHIRTGTAIALTGFGPPFDGRYTVSETVHEFTSGTGYLTTATVSNVSDRSLYGVTSAVRAASAPPPLVSATVTDDLDPESMGRVQLAFPSYSDDYVSGWARTAFPGAGADRGLVCLPEVGDEVLVGFEGGSFDRPVVVGGLYNGSDKPGGGWGEHVSSSGVTRRRWQSRAGMRVEFVEDGGEECVQLTAGAGKHRVTVRQHGAGGVEIISDGPVAVSSGGDVSIEAKGALRLKGASVSVEASGSLSLTGADSTLQGSTSAVVKGVTASLKADASAEVSASGPLTIGGAIVKIN